MENWEEWKKSWNFGVNSSTENYEIGVTYL